MSQICNPCAESPVCLAPSDRYSLQDDVYFFVINCLPGFFCGGNSVLFMVCCDGTIMQQTFAEGLTTAQRNALVNALITRCLRLEAFCDEGGSGGGGSGGGDGTLNGGNDGTDPDNPVQLYSNRPQTASARCPDGSLFVYTLPAGVFVARSQALADASALSYARTLASQLKVCLSGPLLTCCNGNAYASTIVASGGRGAFRWYVSGSLPTGLVSTPIGTNALRISGIPTTNGNFTFTVRAVDSFGNYMQKAITIKVWGITDTALPDGTLAADYTHQLTTTNGTAPYTYTLVSGFFPLALDISASGLISGVVGEEGAFPVSIRVRDSANRTCTKDLTLTTLSGCPKMPIVNYTLPAVAGFNTGPWDNYKAWFIEYPSSVRLDAGNKVLVCGRSWLAPYRPNSLTLYDFTTNPATLDQFINGPGLYESVRQQFMVCPDTRKVVGMVHHRDNAIDSYTFDYFFMNQNTLLSTYVSEITPLTYNIPVYLTGEANHIAFLKNAGAANVFDIIDTQAETIEVITHVGNDLRIYNGAAYCCEENVFLFSTALGVTKISRVDGSLVDSFAAPIGARITFSNVEGEVWLFNQDNAYVYALDGTLLATLPYTETLFLTGNVKAIYNEKLNCTAIVGYETSSGFFVHVAYVYDCATRALKEKITLATYPFGGFRPLEIVPDSFGTGYMYTVDEDGIWREIIPTIT